MAEILMLDSRFRLPAMLRIAMQAGGNDSTEISTFLHFAPGAVIREWTLGKGKIIGHYCGLRYSYGSIDKTVPSENAIRLIENAVKYLGGGKDAVRVAVVE